MSSRYYAARNGSLMILAGIVLWYLSGLHSADPLAVSFFGARLLAALLVVAGAILTCAPSPWNVLGPVAPGLCVIILYIAGALGNSLDWRIVAGYGVGGAGLLLGGYSTPKPPGDETRRESVLQVASWLMVAGGAALVGIVSAWDTRALGISALALLVAGLELHNLLSASTEKQNHTST